MPAMDERRPNRRQWLGRAGLTAGGLLLDATPALAAGRRRAIRLAHLTDVHVKPERAADRGFAACLDHVNALPDRPELILFGGDCVFESTHHPAARVRQLWDVWHRVLDGHNRIPFEPCLGNHDVWGWDHKRANTTGDEPLYGKRYALAELKLAAPYRSFDRAGWHFVVLDSIYPNGSSYLGRLDEPQVEWLAADLAAVDPRTPVLVLSHIPIMSFSPMVDPATARGANTLVSGSDMHADFRRLKALFKQHANVKLCLSGHIHLVDRVDYLGVTYLCGGAVCGDWWRGNLFGDCDAGYGLLDLYDDGTFDHQYVTYGWTPVPDPADTDG